MAFICILFGGLQVLMLLSLTGILVSLAALSRLMELTFTILQPTVLFMLRQSVRLIVFWIVLSLRQMSSVLRRICSTQSIDTSSGCFAEPGTLKIGITPVQVPYARYTYEGERLADFSSEISSPGAQRLSDSVENAQEERTQ